jgi:low affinity Fe/Cu permease
MRRNPRWLIRQGQLLARPFVRLYRGLVGGWFDRFAKWSAHQSGRPITFMLALGLILLWLITGPLFHYSDTWQLVINTATTIITFLMVFLIQSTQNRDTAAMQVKLDEVIRAIAGAHNALLDLEELSEEQLEQIHERYMHLATEARERQRKRRGDGETLEVATLIDEKLEESEAKSKRPKTSGESLQENSSRRSV